MKNILQEQPRLLATLAAFTLCATALNAGTVSTTFSFQQGDVRKDGTVYVNGGFDGATYTGAVSGHITDSSASAALSTAATATIGNQFRSSGPTTAANGQNFVGLFSYDLTELSNFITANTGPNSSVAVTSVSFKLISAGGNANVSGTSIRLYQTDSFGSATWSTRDGSTAWSPAFQSLTSPSDTYLYGYTGGGKIVGSSLSGTTNPTVTSTTVTSGATLQWTSSAGFISALNTALASGDKKLYLTANCPLGNADSRVTFNTGTAATVDNRPELLITLDVTTTAPSATWTGATSNSWTTATNWSPSGVPATDAPIIFDSSSTANLSTVLNQDFTVTSVTVSNPSGAVSVGGANNLNLGAGGMDLSAATQNLTVSAPVILGATQSWNVASGRTLSVNGGLSGSSPLTISGAGKVSLGAAATHSTLTTILAGGTLQTGALNVLPNGASAGNLIADGTLDLNGFSQAVNALTGSGVVDNTAAGSSTLTLGNNNAAGSFSGIIQDTGGALAVVKTGSGSLTLTGANDYSGGFTNNGTGIVTPNNNLAFGTGPVVSNAGTLYPTATTVFANALTLNGSTLRIGGGNSRTITWNGAVTATGTSGITADGSTGGVTLGSTLDITGATFNSSANGTTNNITGNITGAGGNLNVTLGTLQLSGASNTYGGTTTIGTGCFLRLDATGTLPTSGPVVINGGGLTIRNTAGWTYNGTITGDGTGVINLNTGTNATLAGPISGLANITANSTGTDTTVSGNITGSNTVTVTGGAILTLAGNNSAMSGGVTLSGATTGTQLNIKSATALGTGTITISGGVNGKIDNTSGSAVTLSTNNPQAWNENFTFVGTNALNLGTGAVTLGGNRAVSVTASTLTVGGNIGESTAGFGITKSGWGNLVLTGTNTYTGNTAIITGKLDINSIANYGASSAIGAPTSGDIQLGSGNGNFATLSYSGAGGSTDRTVQVGDTTPANDSAGAIQNNGSGALTFTAANFNPTITGITATRTLWLGGSYSGGVNAIQGIIQDNDATGKVNVGKAVGDSIWLLSGVNTYTGSTIVQSGGALKLGATASISSSSAVSIAAGGILDTSAQATYTIPGSQPVAFGIDATGSGSSGKIAAAGLNVSNAVVTYNITGTPDDPVYVLATYTGTLTGTFATVDAPPAGYTLNYAYEGNKIALVQSVTNTAPTISDIANQSVPSGGNTGALAFTVGDAETAVGSLIVTGSSSNTTLVPNGNIVIGGSGASRTVTVTPVSGLSGTATITITVDDGSLTASDTFTLTVTDNYLSWATANGVTGGANGDSDSDGVKNLVEYALVNGGERGVLSGNTITFTKRGAPYGSDLTYGIVTSTDLVNWSTPGSGVTENATSISYTFTLGSPAKNFARLKVVQAP